MQFSIQPLEVDPTKRYVFVRYVFVVMYMDVTHNDAVF